MADMIMESSTTTMSMTPQDPPTTPNDAPVVGFDTVIIGILGVCGIGVFIALGIFICRSWMTYGSVKHIETAIHKQCTPAVKRKHHLKMYNKVRLSVPSLLPTPSQEHLPEYYYSDITHTDDATIIRVCTSDEQEVDANNNYSENRVAAVLQTDEEEPCLPNDLVCEGHSRPE